MMHSNHLADALTASQNESGAPPRVIEQFTSIFLVSRGELWRVYDSERADGTDRAMPSPQSTRRHRLFLALARKSEVRIHTFAPGEPRGISAESLQRQLDQSVTA